MALESRLELKLSQKLILTPQLQQAIKLLQMPQLELTQSINQELVENPFLEEEPEETPADQAELLEKEPVEDRDAPSRDDAEIPFSGMMSFSVDDYFDERSSDGRDIGYFNPGVAEQPSFEQFTSREGDLADHLLWQLRLAEAPERIKEIGEIVIGNIDENGYLCVTDEELATEAEANAEEAIQAIRLVQSLDPPGVGARTLKECLLIQLAALDLSGTLVEKIVTNNLGELERKNYRAIVKQYEAPLEDVIAAVKIIESLDPKPARNFTPISTNYVVPDVFIERADGDYQIILNDEGVPRLRLNNYYRKLLANKSKLTKEERLFLEEKLRSAVWLLKSLDQRNRTIYKVTESIIKFQRDFFDRGPNALRPLNLRDVAEDISMHESTVSRVTSSKYLACGHGIFSFRHFFSSAIQSTDGDVSSTTVKDLIKKIIDEENHLKPYSDLKISEILKEKSIFLARRTVAKYREELRIPPHNKRKRFE
ncbi:MAG: RNA polymerase factor sigma-54 [bacterium]